MTFQTVQLSSKNSYAIKSYILAKLAICDTLSVLMVDVHAGRGREHCTGRETGEGEGCGVHVYIFTYMTRREGVEVVPGL